MLQTLGLRHAAINVQDPQRSKLWYLNVLRMELEWEPDADNIYLTSQGQDNLAIHKAPTRGAASGQLLDHLGFILPTIDSVDEWYDWVKSHGVKIVREIKTHRDGARSFYMEDPDGIIIQMIYHPPISARSGR